MIYSDERDPVEHDGEHTSYWHLLLPEEYRFDEDPEDN